MSRGQHNADCPVPPGGLQRQGHAAVGQRREPVVRYGGTKQVLAQTLPSRAVVRVDRRRRVEVEATMQSPSSRLTVGTASSLPSPSRASVLPTFFDTTPASLSSSAPLGGEFKLNRVGAH